MFPLKVLPGKKTYVLVVAAIAYAAGGYYLGAVSGKEAIELIMGFLGLGTLRAGVSKSGGLR